MSGMIKAEHAKVTFTDGLVVDGYRMPDGSFRVSLSTASSVLGFSSEWLGRALKQKTGTLSKSLQGLGFDGLVLEIGTLSNRGGKPPKTISIQDLQALIGYAVRQNKKPGIALFNALLNLSLTDFFRDAFGLRPLNIAEKRAQFYQQYAATISPENWRQMDREEILALAFADDDPNWNSSPRFLM